jgi:Protein of unknown function (DUF2851)
VSAKTVLWRQMMEAYQLNEATETYHTRQKVLERLLHCIWSEQLFRKVLKAEGKDLAISSPGWWNLEAGPDFRNAEFYLDGKRISGDVEIHLNSGDWYAHRHHLDPRYNQVALHVVLYSSHRNCITQDGRQILELEMKDYLMEELRLLQQKIPVYQFPFGPETNVRLCRRFLEEHDDSSIERILDSAGDSRLLRKKEQFSRRAQENDFNQAFYEALMEGMGYKQSRFAFRELSHRVPVSELLKHDLPNRHGIDAMAAILLGTAGLLQDLSQIRLDPPDQETAAYVEKLFEYWKRFAPQFRPKTLVGFCWYPSSTRPANFPARRLTAVAAFFHYQGTGLLPLLLDPLQQMELTGKALRNVFKKWLDLFAKPIHLYWSYHYQFERKKLSIPVRLIGKERGRILTVNVVIPALLSHASATANKSLEQVLQFTYRNHPRLSQNSITRLMEHRLFGSRDKARRFISTAHRQQALHHFFYDFCDNRESLCSRCGLINEKMGNDID